MNHLRRVLERKNDNCGGGALFASGKAETIVVQNCSFYSNEVSVCVCEKFLDLTSTSFSVQFL